MQSWPHNLAKWAARSCRAAAAVLICAMALPGAAQSDTVLAGVEDHCIQPGLTSAHFLGALDGWSPLPTDQLEQALAQAAAPVALWYATKQYKDRDNVQAYDTMVKGGLQDGVDALREKMEKNEAIALAHPSGARLIVKVGNGDWRFLECILWHPDPAAPLHAEIVARWAVAAPLNLQTPYGSQNDTTIFIDQNNQAAELSAQITQATPLLSPAPVMLALEMRPI